MPIETNAVASSRSWPPLACEDRLSEVLHRLAGMHVACLGQDRRDVHVRGVALQHAVGDEHQPVAHLQLQRLHPVAASGLEAERAVGLQTDRSTCPPAAAAGGMAGVDDSAGRVARSIRTSKPVTNWPSSACSASASFASHACSASSTPRRRALRRPPTSTVANSAASMVWPIASVIDTCSVSRSSEKSNVSPPISPAGCSQAGERELPGLAGEGTRQQPMLDLRRQATTEPSAAPTRTDRCSGGSQSRRKPGSAPPVQHRPPSAQPGTPPAPTPERRQPRRGWSRARTAERRHPRSITSTACAARARPCGVPTSGTRSAVSSPATAMPLPRRSGPVGSTIAR